MKAAMEFSDEMLSDFLDEAADLLDRFDNDLMQLDRTVRAALPAPPVLDPDLLNALFRSAHTVKGLSAMLGLGNMNRLTHRLENVLDAVRQSELTVTPSTIGTVFRCLDRLGSMLDRLRTCGDDACDAQEVVDEMERLVEPQCDPPQANWPRESGTLALFRASPLSAG